MGADCPGVALGGIGDRQLQLPAEARLAGVPPVPLRRRQRRRRSRRDRPASARRCRRARPPSTRPRTDRCAAPRRRPWAPPLAPAHASQAIASRAEIGASLPAVTPSAATADSGDALDGDDLDAAIRRRVHGSISWRTASVTSGSSMQLSHRRPRSVHGRERRRLAATAVRARRCLRRCTRPGE